MNIKNLLNKLEFDCYCVLKQNHDGKFNMFDEDYEKLKNLLNNENVLCGVYIRLFNLSNENEIELDKYNLKPTIYVYVGMGTMEQLTKVNGISNRTINFYRKLIGSHKKSNTMDINVRTTILNILEFYKNKLSLDTDLKKMEYLENNTHLVVINANKLDVAICECEVQNQINKNKDLNLLNKRGAYIDDNGDKKTYAKLITTINGKKFKFDKN